MSLSYTNIFASHDGDLGQLRVHPGSVVSPGQALVPLIEANSYWVQANFKEDQTGLLKVGMIATIELDLYPDVTYTGWWKRFLLLAVHRFRSCRRKTRPVTG
ncbi:multidrug resistance protein A [Photobacterium aphoticum]|uniref:Multidrug resistance protein A n=1 Tax=Photobacterium aphoticum TaxID=754436 RepID=A0A090RMU9_9GAMM|nr:multidrug resistance protein A [Photobacterium aphoticum]